MRHKLRCRAHPECSAELFSIRHASPLDQIKPSKEVLQATLLLHSRQLDNAADRDRDEALKFRRGVEKIMYKLKSRATMYDLRHESVEVLEGVLDIEARGFHDRVTNLYAQIPRAMKDLLRVLKEAGTTSRSQRERSDHYLAHRNKIEMNQRIIKYVRRLHLVVEEKRDADAERLANHV